MAITTSLGLYRGLLHNLDKEEAPPFFISDFLHFANMAQNQFRNKSYNTYDVIQQKTDDLRALATYIRVTSNGQVFDKTGTLLRTIAIRTTVDGIEFDLPDDYFHLTGCISTIDTNRDDCDGNDILKRTRAKRLTADMYMSIVDDFFQMPKPERTYHYIQGSTIELRFGNGTFNQVEIDYLRDPQEITLTQAQLTEFETTGVDNSQVLEFPIYVNYEILRELTTIVLARHEAPTVNTMPLVTQSIPQ